MSTPESTSPIPPPVTPPLHLWSVVEEHDSDRPDVKGLVTEGLMLAASFEELGERLSSSSAQCPGRRITSIQRIGPLLTTPYDLYRAVPAPPPRKPWTPPPPPPT